MRDDAATRQMALGWMTRQTIFGGWKMMTTGRRTTLAALMLGAALMVSGCKSTPPTAAGTTNPDGSITNPDGSVTYPAGTMQARAAAGKVNPDGSITNPDGSITYPAGTGPAGGDARSGEGPGRAGAGEPARAGGGPGGPSGPGRAAAPAMQPVVVPSGTAVAVSMSETLSASRNNAGDGFSGVLAEPLTSQDGSTVFPRGTQVSGVVAAAKGRGRFKGAGDLAIELTSIGGMRVSTDEYEKAQAGKGRRTAEMIGGGGGAGALIGGLAGGGKGALIGGLLGAGAGTAGAAYTGNKDVVIPAESIVRFHLTAPLSVGR